MLFYPEMIEFHKRGAQALGWEEGNIWRNTPGCTGCHRCNAVCPTGGKNSMDKGILPRAVKAGAKVYTGCKVEGVLKMESWAPF